MLRFKLRTCCSLHKAFRLLLEGVWKMDPAFAASSATSSRSPCEKAERLYLFLGVGFVGVGFLGLGGLEVWVQGAGAGFWIWGFYGLAV